MLKIFLAGPDGAVVDDSDEDSLLVQLFLRLSEVEL